MVDQTIVEAVRQLMKMGESNAFSRLTRPDVIEAVAKALLFGIFNTLKMQPNEWESVEPTVRAEYLSDAKHLIKTAIEAARKGRG